MRTVLVIGPGRKVKAMIDEAAREKCPQGFRTLKPYLRLVSLAE